MCACCVHHGEVSRSWGHHACSELWGSWGHGMDAHCRTGRQQDLPWLCLGQQGRHSESWVWIWFMSCPGRCWLWAAHAQAVRELLPPGRMNYMACLFYICMYVCVYLFIYLFTLFFIFMVTTVPEIVFVEAFWYLPDPKKLEAKNASLVQNKTIASEAQGIRWKRLSLVVLMYCSLVVVLFI